MVKWYQFESTYTSQLVALSCVERDPVATLRYLNEFDKLPYPQLLHITEACARKAGLATAQKIKISDLPFLIFPAELRIIRGCCLEQAPESADEIGGLFDQLFIDKQNHQENQLFENRENP